MHKVPLYYFDVNDGREGSVDTSGLDCANLEAARKMAVRELAQIIRDEMPDGERESYVVTVRDAEGIPVYFAAATMLGEMLVRRD